MSSAYEPAYAHDPQSEEWIHHLCTWLIGDVDMRSGDHFAANGANDHKQTDSLGIVAPLDTTWPLSLADALIERLAHFTDSSNDLKALAASENDRLTEDNASGSKPDPHATFHGRLEDLGRNLVHWLRQFIVISEQADDASGALIVADLAARLYPIIRRHRVPTVEGGLLQLVSLRRSPQALKLISELLSELPPSDWSAAALAVSPMMQSTDWEFDAVFPRLLDSLEHRHVIGPVLDLANFCCRAGVVSEHPVQGKADYLVEVLGGVISRMGMLEQEPQQFGNSPEEIQDVLNESVSLAVSLCDALGWMGIDRAAGKLNQALEISHRRVRIEAAGALARMGDKDGKAILIDLASDPSTRMRAIAYAEELEFLDDIDLKWRSDQALAEAELTVWLSQPQQMGFAPSEIEFVDHRRQYWPSFDELVDCYLFRYTYRFPGGDLSNIGIAGPVTMSLNSDLADLPVEDIYAVFAGWQAEHPDIFEVPRSGFNEPQLKQAGIMAAQLKGQEHEVGAVVMLGFFLGEIAVVAQTEKNGTRGIAVWDGLELIWLPTEGRMRPLDPDEVYCLYKGRKMLRTFNA